MIAGAGDLNIMADTPSRPVDFAGLRVHSRSEISSSVHSIDTGQKLDQVEMVFLEEESYD